MIRAVIIDDELGSIISLEWEIGRTAEAVKIVGKFNLVEEAILELQSLKPDCVFLDISMPGLDGFKFLEQFPNREFEVIFVTGDAAHAIQAIRERAFDYLLKPVDGMDLQRALDRIKANLIYKSVGSTFKKVDINSRKVSINSDNQLVLIDPDEVIYCESEGSYSFIHTLNGGKLLVSRRLKLLEDLFFDFRFHRIHHSYLINLDKVKSFHKPSGKVILQGGVELPVSRLKKPGFTKSLKL